jgi:small ligand-binding sensory domain FIST
VRHLVGVDPAQEVVAVADHVRVGMRLAFCHRDVQAARRDLVRICSEIRDELSPDPDRMVVPAHGGVDGALHAAERPPANVESRHILGALYISCAGRGGPHFGAPSAEAQILRHALGDVRLAGFFAGGEIARHHLYGYTGVLTVFVGG